MFKVGDKVRLIGLDWDVKSDLLGADAQTKRRLRDGAYRTNIVTIDKVVDGVAGFNSWYVTEDENEFGAELVSCVSNYEHIEEEEEMTEVEILLDNLGKIYSKLSEPTYVVDEVMSFIEGIVAAHGYVLDDEDV